MDSNHAANVTLRGTDVCLCETTLLASCGADDDVNASDVAAFLVPIVGSKHPRLTGKCDVAYDRPFAKCIEAGSGGANADANESLMMTAVISARINNRGGAKKRA